MKPISFSAPMAQKLLNNHKTQTRRPFAFIMKDGRNPNFSGYSLGEYCTGNIETGAVLYARHTNGSWTQASEKVIPKYVKDEVLYVCEPWILNENPDSGNYGKYEYLADYEDAICSTLIDWKSSKDMPKDAARIFLRVTDVRAERVQQTTLQDIISEGVVSPPPAGFCNPYSVAKKKWEELWDGIYGDSEFSWDKNPYVFVYEFEKHHKT